MCKYYFLVSLHLMNVFWILEAKARNTLCKMRFRLPFTNKQLSKIAAVGGIVLGGNCLLMYYLMQTRFHESPYFVDAASITLSNTALVKFLGEPIQFGNPDLGEQGKNYSTGTEAKFEVPVYGSNTKGHIHFSAIRTPPESDSSSTGKWKVTSLEVYVKDRPGEKVVLVRPE